MGWRQRKRAEILDAIRAEVVSESAPCKGLAAITACPLTDDSLNLSTHCWCFPTCAEFSPAKSTESIVVAALRASVVPDLIPHVCMQELVAPGGLLKTENLDVLARQNRVEFRRLREEPRLLFAGEAGTTTLRPRKLGTKSPRMDVEKLPSLDERLRWVLTPPLSEFLSFLGLPEQPYDYQMRGIAWLVTNKTALLADEMGLGKSMQAITAARILWKSHDISHVLIVCPKTLIGTWRSEIRKWWANADYNTVTVNDVSDFRFFMKLGTKNVTLKIVNYERLARESEWLAEEGSGCHDLIIIDEAQRIKNRNSKTAQAVKALRAPRRWALTGTPLETAITDVISIFDFIEPQAIQSEEPSHVRAAIRPFILRRRTEDVMQSLPEKDDRDVEVELEGEQRAAYDRAEQEGVVHLNGLGDQITITHVFQLIQNLRRLCAFEPQSLTSAKFTRLLEDLEEIQANKRKALVFNLYVEPPFGLKQVGIALDEHGIPFVQLHGGVNSRARDNAIESFKTDRNLTVMLLQYRVGSLGLNLQSANYVYLFDRWWNPAVEDQAVKRAHRIGQTNKVFVKRFFAKDTIEERILEKLAERRRLFSLIIDDSKPHEAAMGLSQEEVFSLFKDLKVRPRRASASTKPSLVLEQISPEQFEVLVAELYEAQDFEVKRIGGSHDGGIDLLARKAQGLAEEYVAIQCKRVKDAVGVAEVRQLYGVIASQPSFTRGALVTSGHFSSEAKKFASGKRISLIDREDLIALVSRFKVAQLVKEC